jgi:type I restriction enzyme S subunit
MAGEWESGKLGDIVELIMGQSPAGETCNVDGQGIPLLNGPTEFGGSHPRPIQFTTDPRKFAEAGDLLFCVRGSTTGRMNWADQRYAIGRGIAAIRPRHGSDYRHFVRAIIDSNLPHLLSSATGSTFPNVSREQIRDIECSIPPFVEQKAIAGILGALDDKIESNRRMSATLDALARGLFQSWFVDFDPVRAKVDGRQPSRLDLATAALFPNELEDSELGHIPKGWKTRPLGEVADVSWGDTTTTKASYVPSGYKAFSASGADGFLPRFDFDRTAVVVSAIGANAGVIWLAHGKWSCIKNTLRFWATVPAISTEFLFFATYGQEKWPQRGSAQPFISQGDARTMAVLIPKGDLAERFGVVVRPWLAKIEANKEQSRNLTMIRDTLLPRLLNGEMRIEA